MNTAFTLCSLAVVTLSVMVVVARRPLSSAIYLVLTMIGIGVMYLMLEAPFVAALQWLVYAGAIMVLFVFVVMLFQLREEVLGAQQLPLKWGYASLVLLLAGGFLGGILRWLSFERYYPLVREESLATGSYVTDFALLLFSRYVLVFELLSLVLLAALVGAILLARRKHG